MIKTRLVGLLSHAKKYILYTILWQWAALLSQVLAVFSIADLLERVVYRVVTVPIIERTILILVLVVVIRFICERMGARSSYLACVDVKRILREKIYEKLLSDKLSVNLGYLYENIVAQCLASNGNELFYHTIMNEKSKHNYEIDFILARKNKIVPIEVKSSGYKTHKSLDVFTEKYSSRILKRYLVYTKDMSKDQDIFCMPVYMVPFL